MRCAVHNCTRISHITKYNTQKQKSRFFKFPKDEELLKKWLKFCQRKDLNLNSEKICDAHFEANCFERNIQYEMGLCNRNPRKLKPGSVPTIETDDTSNETSQDSSSTPMAESCRKAIVEMLLRESSLAEPEIDANKTSIEFIDCDTEHIGTVYRDEIKKLQQENTLLNMAAKKRDHQINALTRRLLKSETEMQNMEKQLNKIFTAGMVAKLKNAAKRRLWTTADIEHSLTLYNASAKAYKLMLNNNFPLPAVRTLQSWIQLNRTTK